jgi:hypothetical protein
MGQYSLLLTYFERLIVELVSGYSCRRFICMKFLILHHEQSLPRLGGRLYLYLLSGYSHR